MMEGPIVTKLGVFMSIEELNAEIDMLQQRAQYFMAEADYYKTQTIAHPGDDIRIIIRNDPIVEGKKAVILRGVQTGRCVELCNVSDVKIIRNDEEEKEW